MNRFGYSIFCDDIRNEVGGKLSFIGCYNAVMFVQPPFPVTLPKLCVHFSIWTPHDFPYSSVLARCYLPYEAVPVVEEPIQLPNVVQQERMADTLNPVAAPRYIVVSASIILTPMYLSGPGLIRMRAVVDDEPEEMTLGSLQVQIAD
jgi:hypothetical protein